MESSGKSKFADRLEQVRIALGFQTDAAMADALGIPRQNLSSYRAASADPQRVSTTLLSKFADRRIDLTWLLTGEGPMLRGQVQGPVDVAGLREELELQIAQRDRRIVELEKALDATQAMARALERTTQQVEAGQVSERESAGYILDRVRALEAENETLRDRLKKLDQDEKTPAAKESG